MRRAPRLVAAAGLALALAVPVAAPLAGPASARPFPEVITLPPAWQAEGIAIGPSSTVYSGSLATGAVWRGDLRTGEGDVLVPARTGRVAAGLKYSRGLLFVAGGPTGQAFVHDAETGEDVAAYQLGTPPATFVNDVTVTRDAAWFTDSRQAVLYRLPLERGRPSGEPEVVPLTGDWAQVASAFNANGIAATANGRTLVVINTTLGQLFSVDPSSGAATLVETTAELTFGDGILLRGRELSVVRNRLNQIAVLTLSPDLLSAELKDTLTDPDFAVPTTIARYGPWLYAVNARFGLPPGPYTIVQVDGS